MSEDEKITDELLLLERHHNLSKASDALKDERWRGVQRIYRLPNGYGLSLVNPPALRSSPYTWEAAVITDVQDNGDFGDLSYETPLTNDVEVFTSTASANAFIRKAIQWAVGQP